MISNRVFVDTGIWLGVIDPRDQHHGTASEVYRRHIELGTHFVTTNLVVAEAYTLMRRRLGHKTAVQFLDLISASSRLTRVYSTSELETTAEDILRDYDDQSFGYVDAVSFAVMKAEGLETALALDHHFDVMGFARLP
jgi:hypothetical protein